MLVRERRLLARSLLSIFVIAPAIALAVVELIAMPNTAKVAIVALSLSILPQALPRKEHAAGGDRQYANALTLTVAIVVVPLLAELLGQITGRPYGVPPSEIAGYVLLILGAPLVAGVLVRRVWSGAAEVLSEPLKRIAVTVALVSVVIHGVSTAPAMLGLIHPGPLVGMLLFTVGSLAVGHFLGGPDREDRIVLALESATRHRDRTHDRHRELPGSELLRRTHPLSHRERAGLRTVHGVAAAHREAPSRRDAEWRETSSVVREQQRERVT